MLTHEDKVEEPMEEPTPSEPVGTAQEMVEGLCPPNLKIVVAELRQIKDQMDALEEQLKDLRHQKEEFSNLLITEMGVQGVESLKTEHGSVFRQVKPYYSISDFSELCKYVKRTGRFELFQKRVAPTAVKEIMEKDGKSVPGVGTYEKVSLTFRKK